MSCACQMGYTGRFCESIQDFCEGGLSPPCHPLVTCTNKPTGPECGGCPRGYEGNGLFCLGKKLNSLVVDSSASSYQKMNNCQNLKK